MDPGAGTGAAAPVPQRPGTATGGPTEPRSRVGRLTCWAARPWHSLIRGSLTARLIASLVALVIVTCAVVGAATYTVLRNSLMTSFSQSLQAATQRQYDACLDNGDSGPHTQNHTSAYIRRFPRLVPGVRRHPGPGGRHLRRMEPERDHYRGDDRQRAL